MKPLSLFRPDDGHNECRIGENRVRADLTIALDCIEKTIGCLEHFRNEGITPEGCQALLDRIKEMKIQISNGSP